MRRLVAGGVVLTCLVGGCPVLAAQAHPDRGETIVLLRHGEKPPDGLGQLTCKGLNRALALPPLLIGRYGRPDFLFAPDPSQQVGDGNNQPTYSYVRPLATIEPTAIRLGMPVNTQIGYKQIDELQRVLLEPEYAHALIFVAWEHIKLHDFAQQLLALYGTAAVDLPEWSNDDYETIYVIHITRKGNDGPPVAKLEIQQENLGNSLSDTCPAPR